MLVEDMKSPSYAYETDSGFDLFSTIETILEPLERALIPTGLKIDIPENYEVQVRTKSGLAFNRGLMVLNSPGTVDQGYTGEIKVILFNASNQQNKIEKGMKIAQAVVCPVINGKWINLVRKEKVGPKDRNENGFGSTGV
jgi:dUTP pyrophosphatase